MTNSPKIFCREITKKRSQCLRSLWHSINDLSYITTWKKKGSELWTRIVSNNRQRIKLCGQMGDQKSLSGFTSLSPTTSTNIFHTSGIVALKCRKLDTADLNVADLLLLKLIYCLLQLPGGPRGVHGGSLELTFSLMGTKKSKTCKQIESKASVCHGFKTWRSKLSVF